MNEEIEPRSDDLPDIPPNPPNYGLGGRRGKSLAIAAMMAGMGMAGVHHVQPIANQDGRKATDEEMAAWQARRAQGTPKKRPGRKNRRKGGRRQ